MGTKRAPLTDLVAELLSHMAIENCDVCLGTGTIEAGNACRECGGIGEVVDGTVLPEEIRKLRAALTK